jgi:hypothetical protein
MPWTQLSATTVRSLSKERTAWARRTLRMLATVMGEDLGWEGSVSINRVFRVPPLGAGDLPDVCCIAHTAAEVP